MTKVLSICSFIFFVASEASSAACQLRLSYLPVIRTRNFLQTGGCLGVVPNLAELLNGHSNLYFFSCNVNKKKKKYIGNFSKTTAAA